MLSDTQVVTEDIPNNMDPALQTQSAITHETMGTSEIKRSIMAETVTLKPTLSLKKLMEGLQAKKSLHMQRMYREQQKVHQENLKMMKRLNETKSVVDL